MYHVSAQGIDERAINVHYYYYYADPQTEILCHSDPLTDPVCYTDPQTDPMSH